ncbi:DUF2125 domain-containing protein [Yoonia maritima]|uniref:DUF2125 domain-containing protein n=1 Tax=Yoonia maritima TaxID=1435347 RepID=UPI000D106D50|nr:DUF2125 domain-containing protein [Yoonia maritima]
MRRLTYFVIFLAALYSIYWLVGSRAVERGAISAISQAQDDGWDISYADLNTIGFPSRFDTTVTELSVSPIDSQWRWQAPFLQVFALSYQPNRVIAAFPDEQQFTVAGQVITLNTDGLRASAGVAPNADLSFDDATIEVGPLTAKSDLGWQISWDRALGAFRTQPSAENRYDAYFEADGIVLPREIVAQIDPSAALGPVLTHVVQDSAITFDQPLDRHVFDGLGPAPVATNFTLRNFTIRWGTVTVQAQGGFDIDRQGILDGRITFRSEQWREMIEMMVAAGVIDSGVETTVMNVASTMALGGGALELPLVFRGGTMSIGPLPIGPAPRFR